MFGKTRKKAVGLCVMTVTSCFILAAPWVVLATPDNALAKNPGGDAPPILFAVTSTGAMTIKGTVDSLNSGSAEGRYDGVGGTQVVVNRPAVVMAMNFLQDSDWEGYEDFNRYLTLGHGYSGTLVIEEDKGVGHAVFFFKGPGKGWQEGDKLTGYRINAYAMIAGEDFPVGGDYTVRLDDIRLSVDTGSRKTGHEGSFLGEATVELTRKP